MPSPENLLKCEFETVLSGVHLKRTPIFSYTPMSILFLSFFASFSFFGQGFKAIGPVALPLGLAEPNEDHQEGTTSRILWYSDWLYNTTSAGSSIFIANHKTTSAENSIM